MFKNRRRDPRFPTIIVTELHAQDSLLSKKGRGCVTDLCLGGMGFESQDNFEKNCTVFLTFNMPIEVQGKIAYVEKNGPLKKYGIKFTKLGKVEKLHLEKFVTAKFAR